MIDITELINSFSKLPGIGKKSATRISYFILKNKELAKELYNTIKIISESFTSCSICGNYTTINPCYLCTSIDRDNSILCIVEEPSDLLAIESTNLFKGRYHVLMGSINPLEGISPDKLRIKDLEKRLQSEKFSEILIATNPTTEGEATFLYLSNIISSYNIKISKIATGIPMGGSLEYTDKLTLIKAIQAKNYI